MRKIIIIILFGLISFVNNAFCQDVYLTIANKLNSMPFDMTTPSFKYLSTDTINGYEFTYYYKKDDFCQKNIIFIEEFDSLPQYIHIYNLYKILKNAKSKYHYVCGLANFLYCYSGVTPDTFSYYQNQGLYEKNAFGNDTCSYFYKVSNTGWVSVCKIKIVADRFVSYDTSYARLYYHFLENSYHVDTIEKILYKRVIDRTCLIEKKLLHSKGLSQKMDCITIMR
ncbi:MAG: hypothetical protein P4L41_02790 [Flavipsychrobacter sp.]|nr:hypothetical protein [Flavipsychrobacter sp.]